MNSILSSLSGWRVLLPSIGPIDVIEILLIAYVIYRCLQWIQSTRAWNLLKGFLILLLIYGAANLLQMTTIAWIIENTMNIGLVALVIIFQPELRKALEQLGNKKVFSLSPFFALTQQEEDSFSELSAAEVAAACFDMGQVHTGALIVIERMNSLNEYEKTGIQIDGRISRGLLINIFEKNTPLHDGAVIIRGDRITSATCYLPLSDNMAISKALGTRHRAGLGISEVSDSLTVIVSEETGAVTLAFAGRLIPMKNEEGLKKELLARMKGSPAPRKAAGRERKEKS